MKSHLLLLLTFISIISSSKSFRSLSSKEFIEIGLISETKGYKNIHLLAINKSKTYNEIPLKIQYIINNDTLTDYSILKETIRSDVKTIFLLEGDSLKILLSVSCNDSVLVKIKGNITIKEPMLLDSDDSLVFKYFKGNYWDIKQPCIFRIEKRDTLLEKLNLKFSFNENFNFDKFYFQVNIILPDSSFKSIEFMLCVNLNQFLSFKESEIIEKIENFEMKLPGKYIIEIVPVMNKRRINGINNIGYQYVTM